MKIGIDLGGSHIGIGLVDKSYNIIDKMDYVWKTEEKKDIYNTMEKYCIKLIKEICEKNEINLKEVESIGIGFPKKNIKDGIVYVDNKKIELRKKIEKIYNISTYLKNDVKCSGMCEKTLGAIQKYDNAIFLTLGTGIGGAYFYENKLVVPNTYQGMEIGHMIIQVNGKNCRCGQKGCFEEYASMRAFRNKIRETYNLEDVNSEIVLNLYDKKEKLEKMNQIIDEYIEYLSIGLANLINIFEPDAICIGGSFVHYERIFMKKLQNNLKARFKKREIPEIILAKYGNDAGIIGAAMLQSN